MYKTLNYTMCFTAGILFSCCIMCIGFGAGKSYGEEIGKEKCKCEKMKGDK